MEINGDHTVVWDFISHKGAAAVVTLCDDGRILMVRQYRNALERYTLEIPAGALDAEDEPGIVCAARELEEETGYRAANWRSLGYINTSPGFCDEKLYLYLASGLEFVGEHPDEGEIIKAFEYKLTDVEKMILTGEINDAKTICAIHRAFSGVEL